MRDAMRWGNQVKLRHLRVVLAIVDCGGVTAAARHLFISQAAVSKTVAEVEAAVGIRLFRKHGRILGPTEAGERFIAGARRISGEINNLSEDLNILSHGGRGILRVGLQAVTAHDLFIRAIAATSQRHPKLRIQLRNGILSDLLQDLRAGRIDVVFGRLSSDLVTPDLVATPILAPDSYVVVASPHHPVLSVGRPVWPDLLAHAWCLPLPETPLRRHFDMLMAQQLIGHVNCVVETSSLASILMLAQEMPLLSLAPEQLAQEWQAIGKMQMLPFRIQPQIDTLGLVWSGKSEALSLLRLFEAELQEQARLSPLRLERR